VQGDRGHLVLCTKWREKQSLTLTIAGPLHTKLLKMPPFIIFSLPNSQETCRWGQSVGADRPLPCTAPLLGLREQFVGGGVVSAAAVVGPAWWGT
jgi:hypothetical protein